MGISGALLLCALSAAPDALAQGVSVTAATNKQKAEAAKVYRQGLDAFNANKFEEALGLLKKSYDMVASPNSRLVIAHTLVQLGREPEAYRELESAVELARELAKVDDKYAKTAESAEKELEDLGKKMALVVVQPSAQVTIDGEQLSHLDWGRPQPLRPGKVAVVMRHEGGQEVTQELDLGPGERAELSTSPPAPPPVVVDPPKPAVIVTAPAPKDEDSVHKRTLAYVTGALGLAGAATFGAFMVLDGSIDDRAGCAAGICPEATVGNAATSGSYQAIAFVGLGVGVIGLGTSAYFFATSEPATPAETPTAALAILPGRVALEGTF